MKLKDKIDNILNNYTAQTNDYFVDHFNEHDLRIRMTNNKDGLSTDNNYSKQFLIISLIFKIICRDIESGVKYNSDIILSIYKDVRKHLLKNNLSYISLYDKNEIDNINNLIKNKLV